MHAEVQQFVERVRTLFPDYFTGKRVLEIGSLNVNGSIREYFRDCDYTGIDLIPGEGVDQVVHAADMVHAAPYDVVISTEALEHDMRWRATLQAMKQNLKPGGLMIITCAGPEREEHGTHQHTPQDSPATNDYYNNLTIDHFYPLELECLWNVFTIGYARQGEDLQFYGIKAAQ